MSAASVDVLGDELRGGHVGGALVVGALRRLAAAPAPAARVGIAFEPRRADAALDLAAVVAKLGLVEDLAAVLADDDGGAGL